MFNRKIDACKRNPENSSITEVSQHIPTRFSVSAISSFRSIENKHDVYRGKEELIKQKMKLLTKEQQKSYKNAKVCYVCEEKSENKYVKYKNIVQLEMIVIKQRDVEVLPIAYAI